jgi:hypothetical protein
MHEWVEQHVSWEDSRATSMHLFVCYAYIHTYMHYSLRASGVYPASSIGERSLCNYSCVAIHTYIHTCMNYLGRASGVYLASSIGGSLSYFMYASIRVYTHTYIHALLTKSVRRISCV